MPAYRWATLGCGVTEGVLAEKAQFANVIQLQVATEALRTLALNPDVSVNPRNVYP